MEPSVPPPPPNVCSAVQCAETNKLEGETDSQTRPDKRNASYKKEQGERHVYAPSTPEP